MMRTPMLVFLFLLSMPCGVLGFQSAVPVRRQPQPIIRNRRWNERLQQSSSSTPPTEENEADAPEDCVDEDAPAGIEGAQLFGSNKRKAKFYDPVAENEAGLTNEVAFLDRFPAFPDVIAAYVARDLQRKAELYDPVAENEAGLTNEVAFLDRFQDTTAFPDCEPTFVARDLQQFYTDEEKQKNLYSPKVKWESPFSENGKYATPAAALKAFHRNNLNIAIVSAYEVSRCAACDSLIKVRWELGVRYPSTSLWEPSKVLTGTSMVCWDGAQIFQQSDVLDNAGDDATVRQFLPRFWDLHHIGMTPAAEDRTLTGSGSIVTVPPRWVWRVRYTDTDRESSNASHLPDHAFTTIIKTMGPMKQACANVTGIQVALRPSSEDESVEITWTIPLSVGYAACPLWRTVPGEEAEFVFIDQPQRFAVASYDGEGPQDEEIAKAQERLYESAVVKGGNKPVLSEDGRPKFSFGMNTVMACFTEMGLGEVVYEARPNLTRPNQIVLELER